MSKHEIIPPLSRQRKLGLAGSFVHEKCEGSGVKFKETDSQAKRQVRLLTIRFAFYGLLGLAMALTWITAFAAVYSESTYDLWYPFTIFNGSQVIKNLPKIINFGFLQ